MSLDASLRAPVTLDFDVSFQICQEYPDELCFARIAHFDRVERGLAECPHALLDGAQLLAVAAREKVEVEGRNARCGSDAALNHEARTAMLFVALGNRLVLIDRELEGDIDGEKVAEMVRARFNIPISDEVIAETPFYRPAPDSAETRYLLERRKVLGGEGRTDA